MLEITFYKKSDAIYLAIYLLVINEIEDRYSDDTNLIIDN